METLKKLYPQHASGMNLQPTMIENEIIYNKVTLKHFQSQRIIFTYWILAGHSSEYFSNLLYILIVNKQKRETLGFKLVRTCIFQLSQRAKKVRFTACHSGKL